MGDENRSHNKPPPGKKRVGDWKGMRVRSNREIRNGLASLPAGTIFVVESATIGLSLRSEPCACCGISFSVSRVETSAVQPVPAAAVSVGPTGGGDAP